MSDSFVAVVYFVHNSGLTCPISEKLNVSESSAQALLTLSHFIIRVHRRFETTGLIRQLFSMSEASLNDLEAHEKLKNEFSAS